MVFHMFMGFSTGFMKLEQAKKVFDRQLIKWVKNHYWDSLEKDKDLILRHLRTFVQDDSIIYNEEEQRILWKEAEEEARLRDEYYAI